MAAVARCWGPPPPSRIKYPTPPQNALSDEGSCGPVLGSTSLTANEAAIRSATGSDASYVSLAVWNLQDQYGVGWGEGYGQPPAVKHRTSR